MFWPSVSSRSGFKWGWLFWAAGIYGDMCVYVGGTAWLCTFKGNPIGEEREGHPMKQPQGMSALDNARASSALIKTPKWTVSKAKTPVYHSAFCVSSVPPVYWKGLRLAWNLLTEISYSKEIRKYITNISFGKKSKDMQERTVEESHGMPIGATQTILL